MSVAVIGAGPAGLAAAAALRRRGVACRVLDRGSGPGGMYARVWPALQLSSPRRFNGLPGAPRARGAEYESAAEYAGYLATYAVGEGVAPEYGVEVEAIRPTADGWTIATSRGPVNARHVVAATGEFDSPWTPPYSGAPSCRVLHSREFAGPEAFRGARVVVVGAGTSATELVEALASIADIRQSVRRRPRVWSQRWLGVDVHAWGAPWERLPVWTAPWLCRGRPTLPGTDLGWRRLVAAGRVTFRPPVEAIEGREVRYADGSREEVDAVIWATGYRPAWPYLPADHPRRTNGAPATRGGESASHPGLFFPGMRCGRALDSEFLRGIARDSVAIARVIAGRDA